MRYSTAHRVYIHLSQYIRPFIRRNLGSSLRRMGFRVHVPWRIFGMGDIGTHTVWHLDRW